MDGSNPTPCGYTPTPMVAVTVLVAPSITDTVPLWAVLPLFAT